MTSRLLTDKKIVGAKQVTRALKNNEIKLLYVAKDADLKVTKDIVKEAQNKEIEIIYVDSKKKLGEYCKIDIDAAVAALLI